MLKSEVLLQLFSLYVQQGKPEKAVRTIKEAVELNPDYSDVTQVAQTYLESISDWDNAVELAVGEALRTQSPSWFDVLSGYVEKGLTAHYEPRYFNDVLESLLHIDHERFEDFTTVLWSSYQPTGYYLEWLRVMNQLLLTYQDQTIHDWRKLPALYQEAYLDMVSGRFLIREISDLMPDHLQNWLNITSESAALVSSTAALAWNETFSSKLNDALVRQAEFQFETSSSNETGRKDGIALFDSIQMWAQKEGLQQALSEVTDPMLRESSIEASSPLRIRELIKTSIAFLLEQKTELEKGIQEEIEWHETLLARLSDTHNQVGEMETDLTEHITDSFRSFKESLTQKMMREIPKRLQSCSEYIKEDSNFSTLHEELNAEMNKQVALYLRHFTKNHLKDAVQRWIEYCKGEFQDSQATCNEFSAQINQQFNEEKIALQCDFRVLEDWQRDLDRMSRSLVNTGNITILRNTPSQLLLKSAGKVFHSISKNNDMLHSKYKNYIEQADYSETAKEIVAPFTQQLELFEGSIEWDIREFLSNPLDELKRETEQVQVNKEAHESALHKMEENPEVYRDPLTLFKLKLRQYELMNGIS
ncbi:hypothetical protein JNUCC1_01706 [Lentibacillus sp. JNUCC-1]|uniref:tetratricopeptide repeat protein n=1 Tax=Lentibacillus sp. JNUCC-1 TaxID=2654513 RepID=UPI001325D543|nr:hypothetical protein [Lentibacillus sp. JNUCC-1]MUV37900.1 hypothetical protein [Lentibacillus sp. JNUCC-1]